MKEHFQSFFNLKYFFSLDLCVIQFSKSPKRWKKEDWKGINFWLHYALYSCACVRLYLNPPVRTIIKLTFETGTVLRRQTLRETQVWHLLKRKLSKAYCSADDGFPSVWNMLWSRNKRPTVCSVNHVGWTATHATTHRSYEAPVLLNKNVDP